MDDWHLMELVSGKTRAPPLPPMPPLQLHEREDYMGNPLLQFRLNNSHRAQVQDSLMQLAARDKVAAWRALQRAGERPLPEGCTLRPAARAVERLQEEVATVHQVPLHPDWEADILESLPEGPRDRYPGLLDALLEQVRAEYMQAMDEHALQYKILPVEGGDWPLHELQPYRNGRSDRYDLFLKRRRRLKSTLFITHPVVRHILNTAQIFVPPLALDFAKYRAELGLVDLPRLRHVAQLDVRKVETALLQKWYPKLAAALGVRRALHPIPPEQWARAVECATSVVRVQVTELKRRTVLNMLKVLEDPLKVPFIKLELTFEDELCLFPDLEEYTATLRQIMEDVLHMAGSMTSLETWVDVRSTRQIIPTQMNDDFLEWANERLVKLAKRLFDPVMEYLQSLSLQFGQLHSPGLQEEVRDFVDSEHPFQEVRQRLGGFLRLSRRVALLVPNLYFDIGRLAQTDIIKQLKTFADDFIKAMADKLGDSYVSQNSAIDEAFQMVLRRAQKEPQSTEELMEMGEFMLWASTKLLRRLRRKLAACVRRLEQLMEVTDITPELLESSSNTLLWLQRINPILEENSTMFEVYKSKFEERLVARMEKLKEDLEGMFPKLKLLDRMDDCDNVHEYFPEMANKFLRKLEGFAREVLWINKEERLFKFPASKYPKLAELREQVLPFAKLLHLLNKWQLCRKVWLDGSFLDLTHADVEEQVDMFFREVGKYQKMFRARVKEQREDLVPYRFQGSPDDHDLRKLAAPLKLTTKALTQVREFRPKMLYIELLRNPALTKKHWKEMSEAVGFDLTPDAGTTLNKILDMNLNQFMEQFEVTSMSANKELGLREALAKMKEEWKDMCFETMAFKGTEVPILSKLTDIQALLDDHLMKTLSMKGSIFVKPIEQEVKDWYALLERVNSTVDEWGKVQAQWLYLLPIFSSDDIVKQMPTEGQLYQRVDATYRKLMGQVMRDPHVLHVAGAEGVLESLQESVELLDTIGEGVNAYLEMKRLFFARFFFLSNDEMLEILSETKDPLRVQPHLRKCFEGIEKLEFDPDLEILAMISAESERVPILEKISTKAAGGSVEIWLVQVEEQMKATVRDVVEKANKAYAGAKRTAWVTAWPGQVVLCVSQMYWTAEMHLRLNSSDPAGMEDYTNQLKDQINDIVALVRGNLSKMARITLEALVVLDVHSKDVTEDLTEREIRSDKDFAWLAQLRYYWEKEDALVRCTNALVRYFYEYLGNSARLVITPLTDRCYRTLIGAYHLHLNGAPEGPAGTGKTETTKDLAKAIAVCCVVFNCSDGLDYIAMGKFFKGLASAGAWACFDEFNRIELEVLSVIAQQILCIIQAVRANVDKFVFEGTEIRLNPACYVCITMNPGYAGRSELPDNLKVLFRTVAMMVPDYALIGEISLYSCGFVDARVLSVKIVTTYRLCSEQLSSQNHYDYGMRAVKSVLSAAGNLKRKFPDESEDVLILRSIMDVNLPKFLSHDVPLFEGIMSDLFHGVVLPTPDYVDFHAAIKEVCAKKNLQATDFFVLKITQTYEMMLVRHGFMLVGMPVCGKTSSLQVLAEALSLMHERGQGEDTVEFTVINPKAITMGQLFGQFDPVSYAWSDGVVAKTFRTYVYAGTPGRKWVIFDGPVDAVWIENMNTVLDDNKKLCLTSGDIIQMTAQMSMIFEVMDLEQASPATVSRCGMIYMEPSELGWEPLADSWVAAASPSFMEGNQQLFSDMLRWVLTPSLEFIRLQGAEIVSPGAATLVLAFLGMLEMLLTAAVERNKNTDPLRLWIQAAFLYAGVWTVGGILTAESREQFDEFYRDIWTGPDAKIPGSLEKIDLSIPPKGLLHDYYYTFKDKGVWLYWPETLKTVSADEAMAAQQIVVPTVDSAKYMYVMDLHVKQSRAMLLVGETGTGKSLFYQNKLMTGLPHTFEPSFITFTAQTSANQTQDLVLSKLNKRSKGRYGPQPDSKAVIFVDNINMPAKEIYGAQPPLELLRQFFDCGIWYDLKDATPIVLEDVMFVAAMGPPGGSRQDVYQRFLRHFAIYSINAFSEESMVRIFNSVLLIGLKSIVGATLAIYMAAVESLRPTPAKSHYIFNLRDFSRVIQGCALFKKESADDKRIFTKLFVHEALRVFGDRLVDAADRDWLLEKLRAVVQEKFKEALDQTLASLLPPGKKGEKEPKVTVEVLRDLMFGNFMDPNALDDEKKYEVIPSQERILEIATTALEEYNATHKAKMHIVLFKYALEHLCRICRVLSMPSGNALLAGVGGSGRQSLSKLATVVVGNVFCQPEITKTYSLTDWRDDLKRILKDSGGANRNVTFLLAEAQLETEAYLQDVDSLLNAGEVPNLYALDERQEILEMVRLAAQGGNRHLELSSLRVFAYFVNRCKEKLHIVLCFSPIGAAFRSRLRLYPSLVNCCNIDWFEMWPEDALDKVANTYMQGISLPAEVKGACMGVCKHFHVTARVDISYGNRDMADQFFLETRRRTYVTSPAYLELIRSFSSLITEKQDELTLARQRYLTGLEKLDFAATQVKQLQVELNALQPKLVAAAEDTQRMLETIDHETIQVQQASELVRQDEEVANEQAAAATEIKKDCEADLALALPALNDALAALNTLKPADITLVKSMKNPPAAVKLVMAAVCVMKGVKPDKVVDKDSGKKIDDYWGPSKRVLGDLYFLANLRDYDKDNIDPAIMKKIRAEYIPNKDFRPQVVAKASSAAEGLCKWIIAMDLYDGVAKVVAPKRAKLQAAELEYTETMALLDAKRAQLAELEAKLAVLNEQLQEAQKKRDQLEDEVEDLRNKLIRAEKIIGGLGGERDRWTEEAARLLRDYNSVAGDILLSCGMIAYLGPFSATYRQQCLEDWEAVCKAKKIPCSEAFSFAKVLGSDIRIQTWNIAGLPRDAFSVDNGIIVERTSRWCLMVDPQSQANKWIKNLEKENDLATFKFAHSDYMKTLEKCVREGRPALLENVLEDLEAPLDPILFKQTFSQGKFQFISLGEDVVEYDPNFRFYITSKMRNPHFLPEVCNKVTVVNFALTVDGLQDQLLGIVVAKERPDLEKNRQRLIVEGAANNAALKKVEDDILITLSKSSGNILEDEEAVEVLDSSKALSTEIQLKAEAAKVTAREIDAFRKQYEPLARHSAVLYYCVTDLPNVDPMYQYSLAWFINLYVMSIDKCQASAKRLGERLAALQDSFTFNLYNNVCRSLFEKDKLLFSFVLCCNIMLAKEEMSREVLQFFLTGGVGLENTLPNPAAGWLADRSWDELCRLGDVGSFKGIREDFEREVERWRRWVESADPPSQPLPGAWAQRLQPFEVIALVRVLRQDKVVASVRGFVERELGSKYVQPPPFDIERSYEDSDCLCPLIFILSPGADPMAALLKFAERTGFGPTFASISLGQGQGPIASKMIATAQAEGGWVCLQNCHLAVSWMPKLERTWENLDRRNTNRNFRLWLTSYPSDKFPASILQFGVKMTNEPPTGLRQNLLRSYMSEPVKESDFYNSCGDRWGEFVRLLFGLCFFHAVVQERRKFGAIGWNIPYGFNESDLQISVMQLQMFISESAKVPYPAILYMTGECNYGGRVTDDWDRRALTTILEDFVNKGVADDPQYSFCPDGGSAYGLPPKTKYQDVLVHIQGLPAEPPPLVFGLHGNAGIIRSVEEAQLFCNTMLLVVGEGGGGGGGGGGGLLADIVSDVLGKMPENFDIEEAGRRFPVMYEESMNTVLVQEMQRFNKLLAAIRATLEQLERALQGMVVMSPELDSVAAALAVGRVPGEWASVSYPSLKPLGGYVADFLERIAFLQRWFDSDKPPMFWLSGFYFTQAFLTGAMQNYARKYVIAINTLTFDFEVLKGTQVTRAPADGVYVYGLFLDGARWDVATGRLEEQEPKQLRVSMPLIWVKPLEAAELDERGRYVCPLYKTSERRGVLSTTGHSTNYVLPFLLETEIPPRHWVKRGCAMLCSLDD